MTYGWKPKTQNRNTPISGNELIKKTQHNLTLTDRFELMTTYAATTSISKQKPITEKITHGI